MRQTNSLIRILAIFILLGVTSSCKSESDFTGANSATKEKKNEELPRENNDSDANPNNLNDDYDNGMVKPDNPDDCLEFKAKIYNIVLVFDNSGSQLDTDPQSIRRTAAMNFVSTFQNFQQGHVDTQVNMASIGFNDRAVSGAWHDLASGTNGITQDISIHTSNPDGRTSYSYPLNAASQLLQQKIGQPFTRNYVIFLTDGAPNAADSVIRANESLNDIEQARNKLIVNFNASIISIAAGSQIEGTGVDMVKKLSQLPSQGGGGFDEGKYEGQYYRAQNGTELNQVWDDLFEKIGTCK
jgi:hypothetical protein